MHIFWVALARTISWLKRMISTSSDVWATAIVRTREFHGISAGLVFGRFLEFLDIGWHISAWRIFPKKLMMFLFGCTISEVWMASATSAEST